MLCVALGCSILGCAASHPDGSAQAPESQAAPEQTSFTSPAGGSPSTDPAGSPESETIGASTLTEELIPEVARTDDIELRFAIPAEQIDGFIIYYGFSSEALSNEVRVTISELETVDQAGQGKVYRYFLRELPSNQPLFISLAAYRGEAISPKTDVVEIETGSPNASVGTSQ